MEYLLNYHTRYFTNSCILICIIKLFNIFVIVLYNFKYLILKASGLGISILSDLNNQGFK